MIDYTNPDRIALIYKLRETLFLSPEDTTSRKIAADWFEENGEEDRAEALRAICRHIEIHEKTGGPAGKDFDDWYAWHWNSSSREILNLIKEDGGVGVFYGVANADSGKYDKVLAKHHPRWRRISGFYHHVLTTWDNWLQNGDEILSVEPIQLVEFTENPIIVRNSTRHAWRVPEFPKDHESNIGLEWGHLISEGRHANIFRREFRKRWPYLEFVTPEFSS